VLRPAPGDPGAGRGRGDVSGRTPPRCCRRGGVPLEIWLPTRSRGVRRRSPRRRRLASHRRPRRAVRRFPARRHGRVGGRARRTPPDRPGDHAGPASLRRRPSAPLRGVASAPGV